MIIKVLWPYSTYDVGHGLPVISSSGTEVTQLQFDAIITEILKLPLKSRPTIVEDTGTGSEEPADLIPATEGWVNDRLAALGASRIPYRQSAAAATWTVVHNLGTKPGVTLFTDGDGSERVMTDVFYPDDNTVVIEWPNPTTGWAYVG